MSRVVDHDPARDARAFEPVVLGPRGAHPPARGHPPRHVRLRHPWPGALLRRRRRAGRASRLDHHRGGRSRRAPLRSAWPTARSPPCWPPDPAAPDRPEVIGPGRITGVPRPPPRRHAGVGHGPVDLIDVWRRLGLRTLGHLAALDAADVLARFATDGVVAHRLASGLDPHPLDARRPAPDLRWPPSSTRRRNGSTPRRSSPSPWPTPSTSGWPSRGLACTRVVVEAETEHGETLVRSWRHEGTLSAGAIADRVRWQLDGWLSGVGLRAAHRRHQPADPGARRGGGGARSPARVLGRRDPGRRAGGAGRRPGPGPARLRCRHRARDPGRSGAGRAGVADPGRRRRSHDGPAVARPDAVAEPWPGRVPAPVTGHGACRAASGGRRRRRRPAGRRHRPGHGHRSSRPGWRSPVGAGRRSPAWAGPWPADERWWDHRRHRRRARFQVAPG